LRLEYAVALYHATEQGGCKMQDLTPDTCARWSMMYDIL